MENAKSEEENIIKDIKNLFTLREELNYTAIKDVRNLFRLEKETKAIKDRILRDVNSSLGEGGGGNLVSLLFPFNNSETTKVINRTFSSIQ